MSDTEQSQDLDSILNEYESKTQPQPESNELNEKVDKIYEAFQTQQQQETEADIEAAVNTVKGELDVDPDFIRGYLEVTASKDEEFKNAFLNRKASPAKYQQALGKIQEKITENFSRLDKKATQDTQEMVAAVSGNSQSNEQPEQAPDYSKMSDADFQKALENI